jgi:hypothetical protein
MGQPVQKKKQTGWTAFKKNMNSCLHYDLTLFRQAKKVHLREEAEKLRREGFLVVEDFCSPEVCDQLRAAIDTLVAQHPVARGESVTLPSGTVISVRHSTDGRNDYDTNMYHIDHIDQSVDTEFYTNNAWIQALVDEAAGLPMHRKSTTVYINRSVTNPRCYHFDSLNQVQLKSFLYLTDTLSEADGPYSFIEGTHRFNLWRYLNLFYNFLRGYPRTDMRLYPKKGIQVFTAKKGTLLITDQRGFHRGIPQQPGHERMVLVNYYNSQK